MGDGGRGVVDLSPRVYTQPGRRRGADNPARYGRTEAPPVALKPTVSRDGRIRH